MQKFVLAMACLSAVALAQGVLDRLQGTFTVLATGVNEVETVFVEIDGTPPNVEEALREGILKETASAFVLVTPSVVGYAIRLQGKAYVNSMPWTAFVVANPPDFSLHNLQITKPGGRLLTTASIAAARDPNKAANTVGGVVYRPPPTNGCLSTSTSTGSTMTCYTNGRVSMRVVCTTRSSSFDVSCRSDTY